MIDLQKLQRALEHFIECVTLLALVISQLCFEILFEGSSEPRYFIFQINVGKSRIRHRTTLYLRKSFYVGSASFRH